MLKNLNWIDELENLGYTFICPLGVNVDYILKIYILVKQVGLKANQKEAGEAWIWL